MAHFTGTSRAMRCMRTKCMRRWRSTRCQYENLSAGICRDTGVHSCGGRSHLVNIICMILANTPQPTGFTPGGSIEVGKNPWKFNGTSQNDERLTFCQDLVGEKNRLYAKTFRKDAASWFGFLELWRLVRATKYWRVYCVVLRMNVKMHCGENIYYIR